MAADFYTLQGVADIAEEGRQALNVLSVSKNLDTDTLVEQAISHITEKINKLKDSEADFLNYFDCSSLSAFKNRVAAYYNSNNLINYTGFNLRKYTEEYKAASSLSKEQLAADMNTILYNLFNKEFASGQVYQDLANVFDNKEITQAAAKRIANLVIQELSSFGIGTLQSSDFILEFMFKGKENNVDDTALFKMCADLTTKVFQKDISNLKRIAQGELTQLEGKTGKTGKKTIKEVTPDLVRKAQSLIKSNVQTKEITSTSMEQTFVVDWSKLIQEATHDNSGRASELKYAEDSDELKAINTQITNMIISDLNINSRFQTYARKKITEMWNQEPTMFFIGRATTQLTGILGEINAMVALSHLLGDRFNDKIIQWVGADSSGGKQPSIDIALTDIANFSYGIQVKNTNEELTDIAHYINFADKSVDSILQALGIDSGQEAIKNVYTSDVFNVPYKQEGNMYVEVGYNTEFRHNDFITKALFDEYVRIDQLIDTIVNQINLYLMRFASDFLYMGFENNGSGFKSALAALDSEVSSLSGNFVYIVGKEVFFASEMLSELQEQLKALQDVQRLEEQTSIKMEAYFGDLKEDQNTRFNIVSAMNGGGHLSSHTIKLKSSWGFHK